MVDRFELDYRDPYGEDAYMAKTEDGGFVRYRDYAALEAKNARLVTEEMVNRAWARASEMSRGTIMANKSALREVLKAALTESDVEWEAIIHAQFETVGDGLIGTTSAPIKRIERQDDGSLTVVIDHWPTHTARAPKVSEDLVKKKVISILEDIEPWALDDTGLHIPDTQIEEAAEKIMCILTAALEGDTNVRT